MWIDMCMRGGRHMCVSVSVCVCVCVEMFLFDVCCLLFVANSHKYIYIYIYSRGRWILDHLLLLLQLLLRWFLWSLVVVVVQFFFKYIELVRHSVCRRVTVWRIASVQHRPHSHQHTPCFCGTSDSRENIQKKTHTQHPKTRKTSDTTPAERERENRKSAPPPLTQAKVYYIITMEDNQWTRASKYIFRWIDMFRIVIYLCVPFWLRHRTRGVSPGEI